MSLKYLVAVAALAVSTAALAQAPNPTGVQPGQPGSGEAGETSDRTPDKATQTPQNQRDTAGGKTSDRSPNKDVKVEHQPGAAGTSGSESSSEGASSGTSGSDTKIPAADPPASPGTSK
jgi:hypothetical protein